MGSCSDLRSLMSLQSCLSLLIVFLWLIHDAVRGGSTPLP